MNHSDSSVAGQDNWRILRDYLDARQNKLVSNGSTPDWLEMLLDHPNLLQYNPTDRYSDELLRGNTAIAELLKCRLQINDDSWLMRTLIMSHIQAATRLSDEKFPAHLQVLLALLQQHEPLHDAGLTLILDRYAGMATPQLHAVLRDHAVERWKNPWLDRNLVNWARVKPNTRRLVSNWLKRDIIREFFEMLSDDRKTSQRRLKFWEQYSETIEDMYFALGSSAMSARGADAKKMRERMGDRLLSLKRAGLSSNNAFIMMMRDIVIVEFGSTGNACFIYDRASLPFTLKSTVSAEELRSDERIERLTHTDGYELWEKKFSDALDRVGINLRTLRARVG
jgi:EH_Signature domain